MQAWHDMITIRPRTGQRLLAAAKLEGARSLASGMQVHDGGAVREEGLRVERLGEDVGGGLLRLTTSTTEPSHFTSHSGTEKHPTHALGRASHLGSLSDGGVPLDDSVGEGSVRVDILLKISAPTQS